MTSAKHVEAAAVLKTEGLDMIGLVEFDADDIGMAAKSLDVDLLREVTAIHEDRTVLEERQVGSRDDAGEAGDRDQNIGRTNRRLAQRRDKTVEMSLQRRHRIDIDDADNRKGIAETGRRALAAGAVTEDRHAFAVGRAVGEAQVAFEQALADGMPVFGKLLDRAVIDNEDRHVQARAQLQQACSSRGRFLCAAEKIGVRPFHGDGEEITAIVEQQIRPFCDYGLESPMVSGWIGRLRGKDNDALRAQEFDRRGLGAVEVACADKTPAAGAKRHQQRHRLRLQMDAGADRQPLKWARTLEFRGRRGEQPTVAADPLDAGGLPFHRVILCV